jgi:hypothetical protein
MNATRAQIADLLREGLSNNAISQRLRCDKHRVAGIRRELGLPNVKMQPLTLEQKWEANTRAVDGGHLEWTGTRQSTSGTPVLGYWPHTYTAARIAFRIKNGREPEGHTFAECGFDHCVAPEHVDDEPGRARTREQLRYLTGGQERPEQCVHGHDQAEHGRYGPDGTAYCEACKRDRKRAERLAVAG